MKTKRLKNDMARVFSGNQETVKGSALVLPGRLNAGSNLYFENSPSTVVREEIESRFSNFFKGLE